MKALNKGFTVLIIAVLLSGCATTEWAHNSLGEQEFHRDNSACLVQAGQATNGDPYGMSGKGVYESCMLGKGWYQSNEKESWSIGMNQPLYDDE